MQPQGDALRRSPPGRWLYWLAGLLWLGVPLGLTAMALPGALELFEAMQQQGMEVQAPGETLLRFENPGDFALFVSGEDADVVAAPKAGSLVLRRGLVLFLESESGQVVSLQPPSGRTTVSIGAMTWVRVATFHIPAPGGYRLMAQYEEDARASGAVSLLVAGRHWPFAQILEGLMLLLPLFFGALTGIVIGVGLGMYVYVRRHDARLAQTPLHGGQGR